MGLTDEQKRERARRTEDLATFEPYDNKDYVFVSYKSDDWETVLDEIVRKLINDYSLRVYYDKNFDKDNESWVDNMQNAIKTGNCKAVLAFVSKNYMSSYACLMELLMASSVHAEMAHHKEQIPIIPIIVDDSKNVEAACNTFSDKPSIKEWSSYLKILDGALKGSRAKDETVGEVIGVLKDDGDAVTLEEISIVMYNILAYKTHERKYSSIEDVSFFENLYMAIEKISKGSVFDEELHGTCPKEKNVEELKIQENKIEEESEYEKEIASQENIDKGVEDEECDEEYDEEMDLELIDEDIDSQHTKKIKRFSLTGDIKYTLYGQEYIENQADMMLRVFAQVLKRHENKVATLPEQAGMGCVKRYEDIVAPNTKEAKPSYFRACREFKFTNGESVCIGTGLSIDNKMKSIARLLEICEEDSDIFQSEQIQIPTTCKTRKGSSVVTYRLFGRSESGDQTEMMCNICKSLIDSHPEKLDELAENTLCITMNREEAIEKSYFRVSRAYFCNGREYIIGAAFNMAAKLKEIQKVFAICGEDIDDLQIEGYEFEKKEKQTRGRKKAEKNFFE